jgi:CheY-like chemotaxis protein
VNDESPPVDGAAVTTPAGPDVLVAEDEPVSHRLLERSLLQWGYKPVACPDGSEALARI